MSFLGAKLGTHKLHHITVRGHIGIIDDPEITIDTNAEIQFFSLTGEYIGSLTTFPEDSGFLNIDLVDEKIGGLKSFEFETVRNIDIPLFNQMVTKFFFNGVHWFTGELLYKPELDTETGGKLKFSGKGYWRYLEKTKIEEELYENKTLDYIIRDILVNYVYNVTPIIYDLLLISVPSITLEKYEIKDKDIAKCFEYLLGVANYDRNNQQYKMGIDNNRHFYFNEIDNDVIDAFFEGFQIQSPEIKFKTDDIVNKINIQRAIEAGNELETVSTVEDTESQEKYGIAEENIEISDFVDTLTAEQIATSIMELRKEPLIDIEVKDLVCNSTPFEIGFYNINSKPDNQKIDITGCDNLSEWDITHLGVTDIEINGDVIFSGRKSMRLRTASGSNGEYLEFTLDEEYNLPDELIFYFRANSLGQFMKIICYDIDGNFVEAIIDYQFANQFIEQKIDLSVMENLKIIRIELLTDENIDIYIDSFVLLLNAWRQRKECLEKTTYTFEKGGLTAKAIFGNEIFNFLNDIDEIKEDAHNIYNIIGRL